ncbi:MAG TPA: glycosyltransferase family 9 protein [Rhabdochlamydiaceae bacterium]|jgi:heptosyltransferase-1|nr:glycosyltransferase family 9 protein [Rhabdochlamydiaceae bacterium]
MSFLIVKTSSIGDVIQTFPVLEYLKQKFPTATIDWVIEKEYLSLVQSHPLVRHAIPFSSRTWRKALLPLSTWKEMKGFTSFLRKEQYDVLFDLQGNTKSGLITGLAKAKTKVGLGRKSVAEFPNLLATKQKIEVDASLQVQLRYLQVIQKFYSDNTTFIPQGVDLKLLPEEEGRLEALKIAHRPKIMIACGSRWPNKKLAENTLEELLGKIAQQEDPYFYFIGGSSQEKKEADHLHDRFPKSQAVGGLSFALWQALMREMDLVLAVDSAALALCGMTKTPSLSFFGPSLASVYKPLGDHHTAWQGSCPYGQKFTPRCPLLRTCKTGACLKSVTSEQLLEKIIKIVWTVS